MRTTRHALRRSDACVGVLSSRLPTLGLDLNLLLHDRSSLQLCNVTAS